MLLLKHLVSKCILNDTRSSSYPFRMPFGDTVDECASLNYDRLKKSNPYSVYICSFDMFSKTGCSARSRKSRKEVVEKRVSKIIQVICNTILYQHAQNTTLLEVNLEIFYSNRAPFLRYNLTTKMKQDIKITKTKMLKEV